MCEVPPPAGKHDEVARKDEVVRQKRGGVPVGSPAEMCGSGDRRRFCYMSEDAVIPPFSAPVPAAPGHFGVWRRPHDFWTCDRESEVRR